MFAADAKVRAQIAPVVRRLLIIDPSAMAAKLLSETMKAVGTREVAFVADDKAAYRTAADFEPGLIFVENSGPGLDGASLVRSIRRSHMGCRRVPIIMVTADATASTILAARDSGVHEFLRKPFTAGDVYKRVEGVALKPRNWIEAVGYVGPDRRRFNSAEFKGARKREADQEMDGAAAVKDQAFRILASALQQFDSDPAQAVRAITERASVLKDVALRAGDTRLVVATAGLGSVLASTPVTRDLLTAPINALLTLADPKALAKTS